MAELTLSASDIAAALKKNLDGFEPSLEARTVGRVTQVGDGIARISGLPDCAVAGERLRPLGHLSDFCYDRVTSYIILISCLIFREIKMPVLNQTLYEAL